jgi:hypothetical protein
MTYSGMVKDQNGDIGYYIDGTDRSFLIGFLIGLERELVKANVSRHIVENIGSAHKLLSGDSGQGIRSIIHVEEK